MRQPDFQHEQPASRRPHAVAPSLASARLVLVDHHHHRHQDPRHHHHHHSHGGIAVTSNSVARVLRRAGVHVDTWQVGNAVELGNKLDQEEYRSPRPVSHIVLHSPNWAPDRLAALATRWPDIQFIQLNHSGLAYLDLDRNGQGIAHIRQYLDLHTALGNVHVAANNPRVVQMFHDALGQDVLHLPNLYYWEDPLPHPRARRDFDPLRVGSFGIGRDWKNQPIAAQAALAIARRLGVSLELHTNIDPWGTYVRVRQGRAKLMAGLPHAKLIEHPWMEWTDFRRLVGHMDLLLSPSYDETFCCVCADGIVEGVPTVGSDALEWLPEGWKCRAPHDQESVAATGLGLLQDRPGAVQRGRQALAGYVESGIQDWLKVLLA